MSAEEIEFLISLSPLRPRKIAELGDFSEWKSLIVFKEINWLPVITRPVETGSLEKSLADLNCAHTPSFVFAHLPTILFVTWSEPPSNYNPAFKIGQERLKENGYLNFCNFGQNLNFDRL